MSLLGSNENQSRYFECRHCGTTVDPQTATCPVCNSGDIAEYVL